MNLMTHGVAHVSYLGGGVFVPTRSSRDRQMLTELVADRAHAKGQVQVLVDDQRWMACCCRSSHTRACACCGATVDVACYACTNHDTEYCVWCALGGGAHAVRQSEAQLVGRGH
jgi:hypothetical protein